MLQSFSVTGKLCIIKLTKESTAKLRYLLSGVGEETGTLDNVSATVNYLCGP